MIVEIEVSDGLLKKLKALSILKPLEGGAEAMAAAGLESWVDAQIVDHIMQTSGNALSPVLPATTRRAERGRAARQAAPDDTSAYDASGISSGLSDETDDFEDEARTSDPEAFVRSEGGLTEEAMDRDMRVSDPEHEAKVDASAIKEKKLTGSDSYRTPEQLFAEHSGLPTPPPVSEDVRAQRRRKKLTGKGKASMFTGQEEHMI